MFINNSIFVVLRQTAPHSRCTEDALSELMTYLDSSPSVYVRVLQKRRKEEAENSGFLSFLKIRALSYWHGKDAGFDSVTDGKCKEELTKMKDRMGKVFEHSLGIVLRITHWLTDTLHVLNY